MPELVTVKVSYEITVPKHQSNELLLNLVWGEVAASAQWVSDELWTAEVDLPGNTEETLAVTFYDRNGAVELASYEALFATGTDLTQTYKISAGQFDQLRWDSDEDGISNFAEVVAGTDPFYDEYLNAEIVDEVYVDLGINAWEGRLSDERPYKEYLEEIPPVPEQGPPRGLTHTLNIDIDSSGNGTVSEYRQCCLPPWYKTTWEATRSVAETSVLWEGSIYYYDSEYSHSQNTEFKHLASSVGADTYRYEGTEVFSSAASYREVITTEVNIVARRIEGTLKCEPLYGTSSYQKTGSTWNPADERRETSIVKQEGDVYWKVRSVIVDLNTNQETIVYRLARNLSTPLGCNFVEI